MPLTTKHSNNGALKKNSALKKLGSHRGRPQSTGRQRRPQST